MAKSTKSSRNDRQKLIDDMKKKQRRSERRSNYLIVGVCVVIALGLIGAAAYRPLKNAWEQRQFNNIDLASIGGPASSCGDIVTKTATGEGNHVESGSPIDYEDAPPAFGPHYNDANSPAPMDRRFYLPEDRPALGSLVHNLEHGYTILWYDETAADDADMMSEIKGIATKFDLNETNFRLKFIAAPWESTDESGKSFPDGQHIAFTHWKGGDKPEGIWQYCSEPSGEALRDFMKKYPFTDAPEANVI